jgi:hypothetical protein
MSVAMMREITRCPKCLRWVMVRKADGLIQEHSVRGAKCPMSGAPSPSPEVA